MTVAEQIENIRAYVNANIVPNGNKNIKAGHVNIPLNEILDILLVLAQATPPMMEDSVDIGAGYTLLINNSDQLLIS
jgi:hypothetical protein